MQPRRERRPRAATRGVKALGWACLLALVSACGGEPGTPRNVILVMLDTLRADHLGSYGYERPTSPFLDAFAAENIQFEHARSQAACTFPSVNSLLTSRHIHEFLDSSTRPGIPEPTPYLPDILRQAGFATAAISASPIVRNTPSKHNLIGGFGRGFDHFEESCAWWPGSCVNDRALRWLDEVEEPFFLYLHYMDPHDPYLPKKEFQGQFASPYEGPNDYIAEGDPNPLSGILDAGREQDIPEEDLQHLIDLYDEEIRALDTYLQAFYRELGKRGLLEDTIVIFTSDHGEAFLEHSYIKHCRGVYDTLTRVPLLMKIPGIDEPVKHATWVENLDVVPTILDYLGLPLDETFAGRSLRGLIEGKDEARIARTSMGSMRAVNDDRFKLHWRLDSQDYKLFDLIADPDEQENVLRQERRAFSNLLSEMQGWIESTESALTEDERVRQAEAVEEELRALGYLP